jgi:hypothetical protein
MITTSRALDVYFTNQYVSIKRGIAYNPLWQDRQDFLGNAIQQPLQWGVAAQSIKVAPKYCLSPAPHDQRAILIGTRLGTVIVHDRYQLSRGTFLCYRPDHDFFRLLLGDTNPSDLTLRQLKLVLGDCLYPRGCPNIGERLEILYASLEPTGRLRWNEERYVELTSEE